MKKFVVLIILMNKNLILGTKKMGLDANGISVDYVIQDKKKNRDSWEDLQWINTLNRETILEALEKWRKLCPDSQFRAIKRQECDFEYEEVFNKIILEHEQFVSKMQEAIQAYQNITKSI